MVAAGSGEAGGLTGEEEDEGRIGFRKQSLVEHVHTLYLQHSPYNILGQPASAWQYSPH